MLFFFFPFFENLGSYVYDRMRARTVLFLKGISATIFSLRSCTACARVLSLCVLAPARRAGPPATAPALGLGGSAAKWTNVVWPIKRRQTNQQTKSRQLRIRQDARAYGFVFERHQRYDFFVEKLYGMRARALHGCFFTQNLDIKYGVQK